MTKHLTLVVIATLCAIALSAVVGVRTAQAAAGDIYNLGTLGGTGSFSSGINDAGQVAGFSHDAVGRSRTFLWDSSRGMSDLGTANGYTLAGATAINASGSVVGMERDGETGFSHAFVWTPNEPNGTTGTFTDLAVEGEDYSFAIEINDAGQVVGESTNSYSYFVDDGICTPDYANYPDCGGGYWVTVVDKNSVLWENGVGTALTTVLEGASAINDAGQVAGAAGGHASRYDGTAGNGSITHDLGTLGGTTSGSAAINNSGQVVGISSTTGDTALHAFRYTGTPGAGGVMADLGALGESSQATDINDAGFVVGLAQPSAGGESWATLWLNDVGATIVDLDAWLDAVNPTLGAYWRLRSASGINNDGLVTGDGTYDDGPGGLSDGYRAFVLDVSSLVFAILGDFNLDGVVDAADYTVWRDGLGSTYTQADYAVWKSHFGETSGIGSAGASPSRIGVPEPPAFALAAACVLGLFICARRRHPHHGARFAV